MALRRRRRWVVAVAAATALMTLAACGDNDVTTVSGPAADGAANDDDTASTEPVAFAPEIDGEVKDPPYPPASQRPSDAVIRADLAKLGPSVLAQPGEPPAGGSGGGVVPKTQPNAYGAEDAAPQNSYYKGLKSIFQYDNWNPAPVDASQSCGQAAVATVLTMKNKLAKTQDGSSVTAVWKRYPPDTAIYVGGYRIGGLGSTPARLQSALKGYGLNTWLGSGYSTLESYAGAGWAPIVLLDHGAMGGKWWTAHWVVVVGYDNVNVYVTNWQAKWLGNTGLTIDAVGAIPKATFQKGWSGTVANGVGMGQKFLLGY